MPMPSDRIRRERFHTGIGRSPDGSLAVVPRAAIEARIKAECDNRLIERQDGQLTNEPIAENRPWHT